MSSKYVTPVDDQLAAMRGHLQSLARHAPRDQEALAQAVAMRADLEALISALTPDGSATR